MSIFPFFHFTIFFLNKQLLFYKPDTNDGLLYFLRRCYLKFFLNRNLLTFLYFVCYCLSVWDMRGEVMKKWKNFSIVVDEAIITHRNLLFSSTFFLHLSPESDIFSSQFVIILGCLRCLLQHMNRKNVNQKNRF